MNNQTRREPARTPERQLVYPFIEVLYDEEGIFEQMILGGRSMVEIVHVSKDRRL